MERERSRTAILGGYTVPYALSVEDEQRLERSRSPYGRAPTEATFVGASVREAHNGPIVVGVDNFVRMLWRRVSVHAARGSQQKLALPCLL